MDNLIEFVNQLQDIFTISGVSQQDVKLPQVVVVGAQSSGKSSVLEHLVGKSFLPRGSGVVTRCPLVLQMLQCPESNELQEYAIFNHDESQVFTDYEDIQSEIEEETERLAGDNKGICATPIVLKLYSSSFIKLTLVDLPGITKIPVGDQPPDIEDQTRDLILQYVNNPNSIILAVSPANADMATSESLKLAREVDPEGERTLAVITKLDLMDDGTDANEMLSGKIIPVKLGIIGVVNRSQKDIMNNKSVEQSLKDEKAFFHAKYKEIATYHGTEYLKTSVQSILITHIHNCLPKLKDRIRQKLIKDEFELKLLGDGDSDKQANLLDLISKFFFSFRSAIQGDSTQINTNKLYGGARINYVFLGWLGKCLNSIDALEGLSKSAIKTATKNASGVKPGLFVPEVVFEQLVKQQIMRLRAPCLDCVNLVFNELLTIVQTCIESSKLGLQIYPKLHQKLYDVMDELLKSRVPITSDMINHFIDAQLAYINTAHPDFLPNKLYPESGDQNDAKNSKLSQMFNSKIKISHDSLQSNQVSKGKKSLKDKDNRDYMIILELIRSYYGIVQKTVKDQVPKFIMHFLVNYIMERMHTELVARLYKSGDSDLMKEAPDIAERRRKLQTDVAALQQATAKINELKPNISFKGDNIQMLLKAAREEAESHWPEVGSASADAEKKIKEEENDGSHSEECDCEEDDEELSTSDYD